MKKYRGFEFIRWGILVKTRDDYKCRYCGVTEKDSGKPLHAHHIETWEDNESLRFVISNGITLCKECHSSVHSAHGIRINNDNGVISFYQETNKFEYIDYNPEKNKGDRQFLEICEYFYSAGKTKEDYWSYMKTGLDFYDWLEINDNQYFQKINIWEVK